MEKINRGLSPLPTLYRKMEYTNGTQLEQTTVEDYLKCCGPDELEYFKAIITVLQGITAIETRLTR